MINDIGFMKGVAFNLEWLSKYRTEIMGFAAILIILCHANVAGVTTPHPITYLLGLGNVGVDIFLFVSGIGMFYSLTKCRGGKGWYRRRYLRILLPYLIITLPWWVYYSITRGLTFFHFLGEVSTLCYWQEHYGAWYIALLIPLYFVTPFIARSIDYFERKYYRWGIVFFYCMCLFITTSVQFEFKDETISAIIRNIQLAFSRVPIFIIGYGLAPHIKNHEKVSYVWIIVLPIIMWLFSKTPYVSSWYRGWMLAIPFTMVFCGLMEYCQSLSYNKLKYLFSFIGTISLESYLANVFVTYSLQEFSLFQTIPLNKNNYFFYTLVIIFGMVIAIVANKIYKHIQSLLVKK